MDTNERIFLSASAVELSNHRTYLTMVNRICYYGAPNLNGTELPIEGALERAKTLVFQPVVARYRVNPLNGKDDFAGHEMTIDENGEAVFGTEQIGTHESVDIHDDIVRVNGKDMVLPCLFAKSRIPTRNKNVVKAIKRLFAEGKLHSSWEIINLLSEVRDGVKVISDYEFEGNCLLGEWYEPAYGDAASALMVASKDDSSAMVIAEALERDRNANGKRGEMNLNENEEKAIEENEGQPVVSEEVSVTEPAVEPEAPIVEPEVATEEHPEAEGNPTIDNSAPTTEVTPPVVESSEVNAIKEELAEKSKALVSANEKIQSLEAEVATLLPYKEEHDATEREKAEALLAQRKTKLMEKVKNSKLFTKEEIDGEQIQKIISEVDESAANTLIADRFIESLHQVGVNTPPSSTETSTVVESAQAGITDIETDEFSITKMLSIRK